MKKVYALVEILLFILLISIAAISFFPRLSFFSQRGYNLYAITSGSMEPAIKTGSLIYVTKFKPEDLKKGDIITFYITDANKNKVVVTHRIYDLKQEITYNAAKGNKSKKPSLDIVIKTKGDANSNVDGEAIRLGQVLGKYSYAVPYLGFIVSFSRTPGGFALLIIIPAVILILLEVISVIQYFKKKYEDKSKKEIAELKKQLESNKKKKENK